MDINQEKELNYRQERDRVRQQYTAYQDLPGQNVFNDPDKLQEQDPEENVSYPGSFAAPEDIEGDNLPGNSNNTPGTEQLDASKDSCLGCDIQDKLYQ